jgi:hypothetical protein
MLGEVKLPPAKGSEVDVCDLVRLRRLTHCVRFVRSLAVD